MNETYFLAVETSCDDTSVSVLRAKEDGKGRLKKIEALSNVVSSQTELHAGYGGVYKSRWVADTAANEIEKYCPRKFDFVFVGDPVIGAVNLALEAVK